MRFPYEVNGEPPTDEPASNRNYADREDYAMKYKHVMGGLVLAGLTLLMSGAHSAYAHCDGLDGPVVKAAQKALQTNNVNLVLVWVQKESEPELKAVFQQTLAVRKLGAESRALADRNLFETLVRLHRAGEGAAYTGLKPAGRDLGPAIPAADRALESGEIGALETLLVNEMRTGLRKALQEVQARQKYDANDVAAGREYVKAYVEYIHFVERLHESLSNPAGGHFEEPKQH
jgi:hypothetical protein